VVGGEGVGAAVTTRGHAPRAGVRVRHDVLAVLPADLQGWRGGRRRNAVLILLESLLTPSIDVGGMLL
jgi:siroheme synthase (precorrin-2 oxidase/ferrochelatase)